MNKTFLVALLLLQIINCTAQTNENDMPKNAFKLIKMYPGIITGYKNNKLYFKDGTTLIYDDGIKNKSIDEMLNNADIEDQFYFTYLKGKIPNSIAYKNDPGRVRNEAFFKKIYGNKKNDVIKNLVEINWCPKLAGQKIMVSKINGVDKAIQKISNELDQLPEMKKYILNIGGTFNWRNINGTGRLSMHSFGITVDINTKFSNYWQWDSKRTNENVTLNYKNQIPQQIIDIFENNGFIWGGKWYHYDTMHFEFRPELVN